MRMILAFTVANYRSFGEPTDLVMSTRSLKTNHPKDGDWNAVTHRATGVFGPNASGKTNLVGALSDLARVAGAPIGDEYVLRKMWVPHKLDAERDVEFFVDFVTHGVRYRWEIHLNHSGVVFESVHVNDKRQWKLVLERTGSALTFGPSSGIPNAARSFINEGSTGWSSCIPSWMKTKNGGPYADGFRWLGTMVRLMGPPGEYGRRLRDWTIGLMEKEPWLTVAETLLKFADVGIQDITIKETELSAERREILEKIVAAFSDSKAEKESETSVPHFQKDMEFNHVGPDDASFILQFNEESLGTRTWIETVIPALYMIKGGGVLIVDEIDSSLHPLLVRELVSMFTDPEINNTGAQLVFTSHDSTLLGNYPSSAIDPEATWLVEKHEGYSEIYALDEFDLGRTSNAEKRYMQGSFGAVPNPSRLLLYAAVADLRTAEEATVEEDAGNGQEG